jgi:hypothetical protein
MLYWGVNAKRTLRLHGAFPSVRYFSYQSYDLQTALPVSSLADYEIEPLKGVNPFRVKPQEEGDGDRPATTPATYEMHITPTGDQGLPNELGVRCWP